MPGTPPVYRECHSFPAVAQNPPNPLVVLQNLPNLKLLLIEMVTLVRTQLVGADLGRQALVLHSVLWQPVIVLDAFFTTKRALASMGSVAMHAALEQKLTPQTAQGTVPG